MNKEEIPSGSDAAAKNKKQPGSEDIASDPAPSALFRLLVRQPPKDHDFTTYPVCKRYGIEKI